MPCLRKNEQKNQNSYFPGEKSISPKFEFFKDLVFPLYALPSNTPTHPFPHLIWEFLWKIRVTLIGCCFPPKNTRAHYNLTKSNYQISFTSANIKQRSVRNKMFVFIKNYRFKFGKPTYISWPFPQSSSSSSSPFDNWHQREISFGVRFFPPSSSFLLGWKKRFRISNILEKKVGERKILCSFGDCA